MMDARAASVAMPRVVLVYGLAGVLPFVAPPLASLVWPEVRDAAAMVAVAYGALILSFLGGARWGLAVARPAPGIGVISLAMLPTLAGLVLLLLPAQLRVAQLAGLAALLALHFVWDARSPGLPGWYPRLRAMLTAGAVSGLVGEALVIA